MRSFLARHRRILVGLGLVSAAVVGYLAFFVFEIQTLVIDDKVDEAAPVFEGTETTDVSALVAGSFIDRSHPSSGIASVLTDGTGARVLRFEDFATDNGPDLNVYLSTAAADAPVGAFDDDFIDLGDLKGNIGNQNYDIPVDVDLSRYSTVVIWCVRFSAVFGAAELR